MLGEATCSLPSVSTARPGFPSGFADALVFSAAAASPSITASVSTIAEPTTVNDDLSIIKFLRMTRANGNNVIRESKEDPARVLQADVGPARLFVFFKLTSVL